MIYLSMIWLSFVTKFLSITLSLNSKQPFGDRSPKPSRFEKGIETQGFSTKLCLFTARELDLSPTKF